MEYRLKAKVLAVDLLSNKQKNQMFSLYSYYYEGFEKDLFYQDLANKHWVIVLTDQTGEVRGFSTLFVNEYELEGKAIRSIFSGDTIIHHDFWGEPSLALAWCHLVGKLKAQQKDVPLYWFLIVKGHRTYRYLRIFSKVFYPVYTKPTPKDIQKIMNHISIKHFGNQYCADSGVIKFNESHGYLKEEWAGVDQTTIKKPDIKFFLQRNPGYQKGDELVCMAELTENNFKRYALTSFREGLRDMGDVTLGA